MVCRARKTKCDGERPTCGFCKATQGNCRYPESDTSRLDQGSLEILTRIGRLEESLKSHIGDTIDAKLFSYSRGAIQHASPSSSTTHTGLDEGPGHMHHQSGQERGSRNMSLGPRSLKINSMALPADVPPSTEILSRASDMSLEAVMKWPTFLELAPHLAADLHTPTVEVLAKDGPIKTVTEQDIDMALQNLVPEEVDRLVDNFLANNHVKNPILDVPTLRSYVQEFSKSGPRWDGRTCLIVRDYPSCTRSYSNVFHSWSSVLLALWPIH